MDGYPELTAWLYDHYRGGAIRLSPSLQVPFPPAKPTTTIAVPAHFRFHLVNMPTYVQLAYVGRNSNPSSRTSRCCSNSKNVSAMKTQAEPIAALAKPRGIAGGWCAVQNPATARDELAVIVRDAVRTMRKNDPISARACSG